MSIYLIASAETYSMIIKSIPESAALFGKLKVIGNYSLEKIKEVLKLMLDALSDLDAQSNLNGTDNMCYIFFQCGKLILNLKKLFSKSYLAVPVWAGKEPFMFADISQYGACTDI